MNRSLLALLLAAAALASAPRRTDAYVGQRIEAHVPFRFMVESRTFPAGDYVIEPVGSADHSALKIQSKDGASTAFVLTQQADALTVSDEPRLVFARQGKVRVLRAVFASGEDTGAELVAAPSGKVMAGATTTARRPVSATRRATPQRSNRKY